MRINLTLYREPGFVETFVNLRLASGMYERLAAVVDTGAQVSLFPLELFDRVTHHDDHRERILIERAGITTTEAIESRVSLYLEDGAGNFSYELIVRAWFAPTEVAFVGFDGVLDLATLHIDYRDTFAGWIELNPLTVAINETG